MRHATGSERAWPKAALIAALALGLAAGGCGDETGAFQARLLAPKALVSEARSVVVHVLDGVRVDGSPLACSSLIEDADPFSSELYLLVVRTVDVDAQNEEVTIDGVPVGSARVFYVEVYDQPGGLGQLIASGCTAGVEVTQRSAPTVDISLQPVP